jgi:Tol biopolymer transport system component
MTTKADTNDDNKQEVATSQSQSPSTAAVESTRTNSEVEYTSVDELAQAIGQIHVSSSEVDVDESKSTTKDEPEEAPEALRKVASWIMDGTVKNILVLTGAGVRYVCGVCVCVEERVLLYAYVTKHGDD